MRARGSHCQAVHPMLPSLSLLSSDSGSVSKATASTGQLDLSESWSSLEVVVAKLPVEGGNRIFTLSTNSKNLCVCFCSTPAPLAIKIHPRKCTESCLFFPCTFSANVLFTNLLLLLFDHCFSILTICIYSSTHFWLLHLQGLIHLWCPSHALQYHWPHVWVPSVMHSTLRGVCWCPTSGCHLC